MGYFRWTPENIEKLRELRSKGKTYDEIAKYFNTTSSSVLGACNRYGVRFTHKWTPKKVNELKNMVELGATYKQMAVKFGVSEASVRHVILRYNLNKEMSNSIAHRKQMAVSEKSKVKEMSNSIALRKQAEELLKAASEMEERENFNKHKHHLRNKLNEIINDYDHLGEKIDELKEMLK